MGEIRCDPLKTRGAGVRGRPSLYVRDYAEQNPQFPHQSTTNQFFTETQFEAYRALGYHAASRAIAEHQPFAEAVEQQPEVAESA